MAEHSCKDCTELYNKAVARVTEQKATWVLMWLKEINPKSMTPLDIVLCEDILQGVI